LLLKAKQRDRYIALYRRSAVQKRSSLKVIIAALHLVVVFTLPLPQHAKSHTKSSSSASPNEEDRCTLLALEAALSARSIALYVNSMSVSPLTRSACRYRAQAEHGIAAASSGSPLPSPATFHGTLGSEAAAEHAGRKSARKRSMGSAVKALGFMQRKKEHRDWAESINLDGENDENGAGAGAKGKSSKSSGKRRRRWFKRGRGAEGAGGSGEEEEEEEEEKEEEEEEEEEEEDDEDDDDEEEEGEGDSDSEGLEDEDEMEEGVEEEGADDIDGMMVSDFVFILLRRTRYGSHCVHIHNAYKGLVRRGGT
jgi:hypothetical protein